MDLSEARGLVLFWVVRRGIGISQRLSASGTTPTGHTDTHPRTRASQEPTGHHQKKITGDGRVLHPRRSSGLRFQFVSVEVFSLLPECQRNGCDLTRQGETHHGRLDTFGQ
jgi:hypothetical protein